MTAPLLQVEGLTVAYAGKRGKAMVTVLNGVSFSLDSGETLGIVGESGCGKSTLAAALTRLMAPGASILAGSVLFEGSDLVRLPESAMRPIRGKRIATILQDPLHSLNPLLSIGTQIAEAPIAHDGFSRAQAWDRARDLVAAVRIANPEARLREYPHQMSGGMRQRIAGAIALSCAPRLLIADEPTTALDPTVQVQYLQLLKDLQREHGFALILITHDLGVVARVCDRTAVMYAGRLVEQGPTAQTLREPLHPYTRALLGSIPTMSTVAGRLRTIPNQPPDPAKLPSGCAFHPRCSDVFERCRFEMPPLARIGEQRESACWLNER
ncbi:MAG: ABC transporter ATP-binding protein [Burkholderiaceae bacterium]|nr:ABC transporter ATP-binding protein [Burkholderiaceae bacterium]